MARDRDRDREDDQGRGGLDPRRASTGSATGGGLSGTGQQHEDSRRQQEEKRRSGPQQGSSGGNFQKRERQELERSGSNVASTSRTGEIVEHGSGDDSLAFYSSNGNGLDLAPSTPMLGTQGSIVEIRANYFKFKVIAVPICHYKFTVSSSLSCDEEQALVSRNFSDLLRVYDGSKSCFSIDQRPFESIDIHLTAELAARTDGYQMQLVVGGEMSKVPLEFSEALAAAVREWPSHKYIPSGRYFDSSFPGQALVCPTMQGLAVNVDLAFYDAQEVLEFLKKIIPGFDPTRSLSDEDRFTVESLLKRLKVKAAHRLYPSPSQQFRISGLSCLPTRELTLVANGGQKQNMITFLRELYGYTLQYPELPCLELQRSKRTMTYLPMELCTLAEGQKYQGKPRTTVATRDPAKREEYITTQLGGFYRNKYAAKLVELEKLMTPVTGRILPAPLLNYGNTIFRPNASSWSLTKEKLKLNTARNIHKWGMINYSRTNLTILLRGLLERSDEIGIKLPYPTAMMTGKPQAYESQLRILRDTVFRDVDVLICIMYEKGFYGDLKTLCETELGLMTQFCLEDNIKDSTPRFIINLLMKINAKLGGKNVLLPRDQLPPQLKEGRTIIFGAYISHSTTGNPSMSAAVASMDWPATTYLARTKCQANRVETIENLTSMVEELLREFRKQNKQWPRKLLFFRDGVSEGQFNNVLVKEMNAIRQACDRISTGLQGQYCPRITFVAVQRRHRTRFFPLNTDGSNKRTVHAGTVVDSVITRPREFDFFLCSHTGFKGRSRPTRYHVLVDENKLSADCIQKLVYNSCYTSARFAGHVSVMPPARYARLAARRARLHAKYAGNSFVLPSVCPTLQNSMYYC